MHLTLPSTFGQMQVSFLPSSFSTKPLLRSLILPILTDTFRANLRW